MARAGGVRGPRERLALYLSKNGRAQSDLAEKIGCSEARVSQLLAGQGRPSPALAHAIQRETGVPALAWFTLERAAAR